MRLVAGLLTSLLLQSVAQAETSLATVAGKWYDKSEKDGISVCKDTPGLPPFLITDNKVAGHEFVCKVVKTTPHGNAIEALLSCDGEGMHYQWRRMFQLMDYMHLRVTDFQDGKENNFILSRCPATQESSSVLSAQKELERSGASLKILKGSGIEVTPGNPLAIVRIPLSDEEGELRVAFDFNAVRGFLGPSTNPSSQVGFSNEDRTLFAVNNQPVTKSSLVHIFVYASNGDLIFLNNVNARVASLLKDNFANAVKNFLRVEGINGRAVRLQAVDFSAPQSDPIHAPQYNFSIFVDERGTISLGK